MKDEAAVRNLLSYGWMQILAGKSNPCNPIPAIFMLIDKRDFVSWDKGTQHHENNGAPNMG